MSWVDTTPQLGVDIQEKAIGLIDIAHTSLIAIISRSSVYAYNRQTLLPVAFHKRNQESIRNHGTNKEIKVKRVSVNASQLQKVKTVNLFVGTDSDYIIIYQLIIDESKSLYELHDNSTDDIIQNGLPLSADTQKFSVSSIVQSAKNLILPSAGVNLENLESLANRSIEDDDENFEIEHAKLSVYKIVKITTGLKGYWLRQNSHKLFIFSSQSGNDVFQSVNLKSFKSEVFNMSGMEWYTQGKGASKRFSHVEYNSYTNHFFCTNELKEMWCLKLYNGGIKGEQIFQFEEQITLGSMKVYPNPQDPFLLLLIIDGGATLLQMNNNNPSPMKKITSKSTILNCNWSPCGSFFTTIDDANNWAIYSKLGKLTFSSLQTLSEVGHNDAGTEGLDFLSASYINISANSCALSLIDKKGLKLYLVNLLRLTEYDSSLFFSKDCLLNYQRNGFIKFFIPPLFKRIISNMSVYNGSFDKHAKAHDGKLTLRSNNYSQLSMTFGDKISISTPFSSGTDRINQILWYNFNYYYFDKLNIIDHLWFDNYLILINRINKEEDPNDVSESRNSVDSHGDDHTEGSSLLDEIKDKYKMTDEILVLNCSSTKYGLGGNPVKFDGDLLVWRHQFGSKSTCVNLTDNELIFVTEDSKVSILKLSKNEGQVDKKHKIIISHSKTIHLDSIKEKLPVERFSKVSLVKGKHLLILLTDGDLLFLRSDVSSSDEGSTGIFNLIKISESVEYFKCQKINGNDSLYVFNGSTILIYDVNHIVDRVKAAPIKLDIQDIYPLMIDPNNQNSIELVGIETTVVTKSKYLFLKNKVSHQIVLNKFIEYDLMKETNIEAVYLRYFRFPNFEYCLELLLNEYLTEDSLALSNLFKLIELTERPETIYINCLRKIEIEYWGTFFRTLQTTPVDFMNRIIEIEDPQLCYNFLIVYLNSKTDEDENEENLHKKDKEVILKIMSLLGRSRKWDWCFELCRFLKLLEPSGELLQTIYETMK